MEFAGEKTMNRISISQAWSYTTSFFNGQGVNHAIVLIGVGILVPLILQFLLGGGATMFDPASMAEGGGAAAIAATGAVGFLLSLLNYLPPPGSYFASPRFGLTRAGAQVGTDTGYGYSPRPPGVPVAVGTGAIP